MSRKHLPHLALLLVATISTLSGAQPQAKQTPAADSAAKDTAAPKHSRFGGLMNRAKQVAGSKAGQKAAELAHSDAVKGAAVGVACTVVPGAAVASAVTGSGPCANSGLMSGLISGNLKGTAAAMASGTASNAASGVAGKVLGKGGVTGAAARGALGSMGGSGAMSSLAAQAAAMRMMQGAGSNGMSDAAASAAAMKMMQAQGMSTAAAAAAMSSMMQNPTASGLSPASAAAAMNMLKGMKLPGGSAPSPSAGVPNAAAVSGAMAKSLYDEISAKGHSVTQGLLFSPGTDRLRLESTATLQQIAAMLDQHPKLKLRIEGHTDNVGAEDANKALSDKRAAAVKTALIEDYHVNAGRLESKGLGSTKPAWPNDTPEGRSSNWRVELVKM